MVFYFGKVLSTTHIVSGHFVRNDLLWIHVFRDNNNKIHSLTLFMGGHFVLLVCTYKVINTQILAETRSAQSLFKSHLTPYSDARVIQTNAVIISSLLSVITYKTFAYYVRTVHIHVWQWGRWRKSIKIFLVFHCFLHYSSRWAWIKAPIFQFCTFFDILGWECSSNTLCQHFTLDFTSSFVLQTLENT